MTKEEKKDEKDRKEEKEEVERRAPDVSGGWSPIDGIGLGEAPDPIAGPGPDPYPEYPRTPGGPVQPFPGLPTF